MFKKPILIIGIFILTVFNLLKVEAFNFYTENLNSHSVYMVNNDTKTPVVEKNIYDKRSPASLAKIVTFIVVSENSSNKNETVLVSKEILDKVDPESSGSVLKEGEKYTINDLLHCMMISSSGYSAMVLANHVGGTIEKFVDMMNKKILEIGCTDTHFENPDGIYNKNQYTTAFDMYKISEYALKNSDILNITSKSEYNMFNDQRDPVITTNKLIDKKRGGKYYRYFVKGIKTGFINDAGRCLISYASKESQNYTTIVMGGDTVSIDGVIENTAMLDSINLYDWAFNNLKNLRIFDKYTPLTQIRLKLSWKTDKLNLSSTNNFDLTVPIDIDKNNITFNYILPEFVKAPINTSEIIGNADIFYKNEKIGTTNLSSTENFKKSYILAIFNPIESIASSKTFITLFIILILFLIYSIIRIIIYNRKQKSKRKIVNISKSKKYK